MIEKCLIVIAGLILYMGPASAQDSTYQLLGDFDENWQEHWMERKFTNRPTYYEVVEEDTNKVLMATSSKSASGLWRMLEIHPGKRGRIYWRWKVKDNLSDDIKERSKRGDDYAARVFVVFEPHFLSWRTKAICYVWSANQPVGEEFKSPYSSTVSMVVVQSGDKNTGKWMAEERDIIRDYERAFGSSPEMITAVAIMVDTDNTGQSATAWFDDIRLRISRPAQEKEPERSESLYDF